MKKTLIIAGIVILAGIAGAYIHFNSSRNAFPAQTEDTGSSTVTMMPPVPPASLTQEYSDSAYSFAFKYPAGYSASSAPDAGTGGETVVVEATSTDPSSVPAGFEIVITPTGEDISALTVDRIRQDLPDMTINDPQDVILGDGANAGKGVAFLSDDADFDGNSRNVWFIYDKNLYQIATYAADDPLLQAVLNTWQFK